MRVPFQQIDASCTGSVTSIYWINLLKITAGDLLKITPGENDPVSAFAVGFRSGSIAIYRQTSRNVSVFGHFSFCTIKFSWDSAYLNSPEELKPMIGQLTIQPSIGSFLLGPPLLHGKVVIALFWEKRGAYLKCMTMQRASFYTTWNIKRKVALELLM